MKFEQFCTHEASLVSYAVLSGLFAKKSEKLVMPLMILVNYNVS